MGECRACNCVRIVRCAFGVRVGVKALFVLLWRWFGVLVVEWRMCSVLTLVHRMCGLFFVVWRRCGLLVAV